MPETQDPDDNQDDGAVGSSNIQKQREHIKSLEKQLKESATAAAERDALQVQLVGFQKAQAFDRLKIPPDGPGKLFRDTYQGDLTDEAIIAKAAEYGIAEQQQPQVAQPTIPGVDQDAWARQQAAFQGTANPPPNAAIDQINGTQTREQLNEILQNLGLVDTSGNTF